MPNECEALLSDGSDLVTKEIKFGLGWNSTSTRAPSLPYPKSKKAKTYLAKVREMELKKHLPYSIAETQKSQKKQEMHQVH